MRTLGLALGLSFAGLSACSLLLDTDSLQNKGGPTTTTTATTGGGSAGQAGSAGQGGSGGEGGGDAMAGKDAPGYEAGKRCDSDTDCLPGLDIDGCWLYTCGPDSDPTCRPPQSNKGGLGITVTGQVETVMTADEIGYPSLLADGNDIFMGVWHRTGASSDVLLAKYPALQGSAKAQLSALASSIFRSYGSSPGFVTRTQAPRKLRMLLAAERVGDAGGMGMRLVDLDVPALGNDVRLSAIQPAAADLGIGGYDTRPRSFPPRLMPAAMPLVQEPSGMWIQQQKLYTFDGATAKEAFAAKRVLGFTPLAGQGVHAALQTAEIADGGPSLERTELWSEGSATLISLEGDQPGPRRGVASTFVSESGSSANIVAWSFETRMGIPQYNYAAAFCLGASCSSLALPNQGGVTPAVFPELASSGVRGSAVDRDVAQTFEVVFADPAQPATAATVLLAGTSRFTILSPDLTKGTSKPINPALFIVDVASGPIALPAGEVLGPSSVAVTADGQVLIAWVVRPNQNTAVLKTRRFQIKVCP